MHFKIYLSLICFVFIAANSHSRVSCAVNRVKESTSKPNNSSKNDTKKISSRIGNDQVFTIKSRFGEQSNQECRCVPFHLCNREDVYTPKADESYINCGNEQACCVRTFDAQDSSPSSISNSTDICVSYGQCDTSALATVYGMSVLMEKNVFSDCPQGTLLCPIGNVLPNVTINVTSTPSSVTPDDDCRCLPLSYCDGDFGEHILIPKMDRCDVTEICCPSDFSLPIINVTTPAPPPANYECGLKPDSTAMRLSGSTDTIFGEFPWMILILEQVNNVEKVVCGGSLISTRIVLTAAHCVIDKNLETLIIRAGEYDLRTPYNLEEAPHIDRYAINVTIHPNFTRKVLFHDLALISVNEPFTYASNIIPICLPLVKSPHSPIDIGIYDFNNCIASGWGAKVAGDKSEPGVLGKVLMKIIPENQCGSILRKSPFGPRFILHPSFICASGVNGADTCKGDGGGPLMCPLKSNPNKFVQIGVIAGGLNCSSPFPGLYASLLYRNSEWITEEIYFKSIFDQLLVN